MITGLVARPYAPADTAAIARICRACRQPVSESGSDPAYLAHLVDTGMVAVAVAGTGDVVGWGAVIARGQTQMLTDLFVDPRAHGHGVGAAVLGLLWPQGPPARGRFTFSSWHAHAVPLYVRAGLVPSWPLLYLTGPARRLTARSVQFEVAQPAHAAAVERSITAVDRGADYAYWVRASQATAFVLNQGSTVVGAGIGTPVQLTRLVCATGCDARSVALAALMGLNGTQTSLCLPGPHPALGSLLRADFRITDHDLHMSTPDLALSTDWVYSPGLA